MENLDPNTQPIPDQAAVTTPQPTQTISAAQLAANRSNAQKSTGPRTPQGKLRSASNSMKHGLYSLTNYLDQFEPVTPTGVGLGHQLIHQQLRFLQMEFLFNQAMSFRVEDILKTPVTFLPHIMRELDRLPARIQRTIKAIRAEQKIRFDLMHNNENLEFEAIPDQPPLPPRPEAEYYDAALTPQGIIALDKLPKNSITNHCPKKLPPQRSRHLSQRRFQLVPIGLLPDSTKRSHALPAQAPPALHSPPHHGACTFPQSTISTHSNRSPARQHQTKPVPFS